MAPSMSAVQLAVSWSACRPMATHRGGGEAGHAAALWHPGDRAGKSPLLLGVTLVEGGGVAGELELETVDERTSGHEVRRERLAGALPVRRRAVLGDRLGADQKGR